MPNTNCAQTKERATKQIQKLQRTKREQVTKPQNQNQNQAVTNLSLLQIATHKYQIIKPRESLFFSHPLISFTLTLSLSLSLSLKFFVAALCLYRRLESASISNSKKD